jgi:hypothetical protein
LYEPSPQPYPDRLSDPRCGCDLATRRVRSNGKIKWAGNLILFGEALMANRLSSPKAATGWCITLTSSPETSIPPPAPAQPPTDPRGRPVDLIEIASAIPTTPQAHQPQHP